MRIKIYDSMIEKSLNNKRLTFIELVMYAILLMFTTPLFVWYIQNKLETSGLIE